MQGQSPPLSRLIEDQPHPSWCDCTDSGSIHGSPIAVIDCAVTIDGKQETVKVTAQLIEAACAGPVVYMHGARLEPRDAKVLAHTLALLGHAELAAAVTRLAEWGTLPPPDRIVNPMTGRLEHLPAVTPA